MEIGEKGVWVIQLMPGHPDHAPPGNLEPAISFTVLLEGDASPVRLAAVQLDDHPLRPPQAIGLDFVPVDVE